MDDLDDNLRTLAEQFKTDDPLPRLSWTNERAAFVVAGAIGDRHRRTRHGHRSHRRRGRPSPRLETGRRHNNCKSHHPRRSRSRLSGVASTALPSQYLFNEIGTTKDGLVLTGEVGVSTTNCGPPPSVRGRLRSGISGPATGMCSSPPGTWTLSASGFPRDNITVSVVPINRETGQPSAGHVVMTYAHSSDVDAVAVVGGEWLWIYDVATTNGPELLQISAVPTGAVVGTVVTPQLFRPIMAANDDGVWLGPAVNGGGPSGLYQVRAGSETAYRCRARTRFGVLARRKRSQPVGRDRGTRACNRRSNAFRAPTRSPCSRSPNADTTR